MIILKYQKSLKIIFFLFLIGIIILTLMNYSTCNKFFIKPTRKICEKYFEVSDYWNFFQKTGHFVLWFLIALFSQFIFKRKIYILIILSLIIGLVEIIQLKIPGRICLFKDACLGWIGILFSILFYKFWKNYQKH